MKRLCLALLLCALALPGAAFPVFDAAALTENILHRILYARQLSPSRPIKLA